MKKAIETTRAQLLAPPEQTAEDSLSEGSLVEVDEVVLQLELSEDDDWRPLAECFAVKPRQATLPKMVFAELRNKAVR